MSSTELSLVPCQKMNDYRYKEPGKSQVQSQAERADSHALLHRRRIEQVLLAKDLQRNQQYAYADFTSGKHSDAQSEPLAWRGRR